MIPASHYIVVTRRCTDELSAFVRHESPIKLVCWSLMNASRTVWTFSVPPARPRPDDGGAHREFVVEHDLGPEERGKGVYFLVEMTRQLKSRAIDGQRKPVAYAMAAAREMVGLSIVPGGEGIPLPEQVDVTADSGGASHN